MKFKHLLFEFELDLSLLVFQLFLQLQKSFIYVFHLLELQTV